MRVTPESPKQQLMRAVFAQYHLGQWFRPSQIEGLDFKQAPVCSQLCNGSANNLLRHPDKVGYYCLAGYALLHQRVSARVDSRDPMPAMFERWTNGVGGWGIAFHMHSDFCRVPPYTEPVAGIEFNCEPDQLTELYKVHASWVDQSQDDDPQRLLSAAHLTLGSLRTHQALEKHHA